MQESNIRVVAKNVGTVERERERERESHFTKMHKKKIK